jgi:SAM-dependent methyltransferase
MRNADDRADREVAAASFDTAAADYHTFRPGYPDATFDDLPAGDDVVIVEVGAGTGQATRALAHRAGRVIAVEPGRALAATARSALSDLPQVEVRVVRLEESDLPAGVADGVFAGASWHWVDPERGPRLLARLLKPGGSVTLAWNRPAFEPIGHRPVGDQLDQLIGARAPHLERGTWTTPDAVMADVEGLTRSGFELVSRRSLPWTRVLDGPTARGLFGTFSAYAALPTSVREPLLDELADLIDDSPNGQIRTEMITDVYTLRPGRIGGGRRQATQRTEGGGKSGASRPSPA